jgi:hypothetical protein
MTVSKTKRLKKTMKSFKNGIESGRPFSKNVSKSSLKVGLGPTHNSAARMPYVQMKITLNHLWRIKIKSCGLVRNENVQRNLFKLQII